ncbi:MAG: lipoyl(octanoyl) transferase LipB [Elusimicrobia bacterium]|nr:lipoyl(octanoyl) transferase LipB [Elusimicrobiota bacterium]MDE2313703.1 lipoyl(octanoyl) transferase LipB [Elusimicrobiota bacterium]
MDVRFLGQVEFTEAWALQKRLVDERARGLIADTLLLLEHQPVYTCGASSRDVPPPGLPHPYHIIERGGDTTYHGPGQLIGYPIVHLGERGLGAVDHLRLIERALIRTCARFGLAAETVAGFTGVWCRGRKIASIGVAVRRNVAYHGFALNVDCDLSPFYRINPCRLEPEQMSTLSKLVGHSIPVATVAHAVAEAFKESPKTAPEPAAQAA